MTKQELITVMAESAGITNINASKALDAFIDSVTTTLQKGDDLVLIGFGSFTPSKRAARTGRNPKTGETIQIAASTTVRFKVGKKLKEAVNGRDNK